MGYSLSEDIEYAEKRLKFLKAVEKKYPDVEQIELGGRSIYVSESAHKDCTDVMVFETDKDRSVLMPYVDFGGGRVYGARYDRPLVWTILDALKKENPAAYKEIVRLATRG